MNAAELRAALNTVEQDHALALKKVQALKNAVSSLLDPDHADVQAVVEQLRDLNMYFAKEFSAHTAEEETTLFPLLERNAPGGRELVARLRQEHQDICRKREEFANCLGIAVEVGDEIPRMVLRDLLADGWLLWELLDKHAHTETQAVHRCVTQALN
jgi:hemerythrin-like domain-containing protein